MNTQISKKNLTDKIFGTRNIIWGSVIFGLLFLIVIFYQACAPRKGTILYGMCSSFLEQQIIFPNSLEHTAVEQYPKAVRIYFTYTDSFGQFQFEMIECVFKQGENSRILFDRVFFNYMKPITKEERVNNKGRLYEVKQEYIDLFNRSLSIDAILSQEPDLTLPGRNNVRF